MIAAAIDLGTNTFHLIIGKSGAGEPEILFKTNLPVRLGEARINQQEIIPAAFERGLLALEGFAKEIKKYNSLDEYVEKLDERLTNIGISKHEILNLDSVENALTEVYDVEFAAHSGITKDQLYISPFMINPINKNPFKLNDRSYPVDLGAATDERISIILTLPGAYQVMEQPKNLAITLPESKGRYILQTKLEDNILNVTQFLQFNQAIYGPEYYLTLKEFYSKIIQNQKTEVLLKKVN